MASNGFPHKKIRRQLRLAFIDKSGNCVSIDNYRNIETECLEVAIELTIRKE